MLQVKPAQDEVRDTRVDDLMALMLKPAKWLSQVNFNFTNRCNVRCVYCPQGTHADGFHADSSRGLVEHIKSFILDTGVPRAGIGVYGETLLIKGWEADCAELLDEGVVMHINSSFNRILSAREAAVLSRFSSIYMSIDTVDIPLHRHIRKAVDVRNIIYDMHMIRGHAIRHGWAMPKFVWTGVMTDKAVFRLREFVAAAISNSASAINFNDLSEFDGVKSGLRHIADLEGDELAAAIAEIDGAVALANRYNMPISLSGADRARAKRNGQPELRTNYATSGIQGTASALTTVVGEGETRLCADPWDAVFTDPKGEVYSCCVRGEVMGKLGDKVGLDDVLNNEKYRKLRIGLLTGSGMDETCANCHLRPAVPVAQQQMAIAQLVQDRNASLPPARPLPETRVLDTVRPEAVAAE
jgi:hypothetical protein